MLSALEQSKVDFAIFTYDTDELSTKSRKKYYQNCGLMNLTVQESERGVAFKSDEELSTIAYHPKYLLPLFSKLVIPVSMIRFSNIGILYTNLLIYG